MKKFLVLMITVVLALGCVFGLTACGAKAEKVKVINLELTAEDYVYAVKTGDVTTQSAINGFLTGIKADGTFDQIVNSFFDGNSTFEYENPSSKDGCLVIATSADFPPFEYKKGNKFTGIDIQIAKLFADSLDKTLYVDDIGFDQVILSMGEQNNQYVLGMAGITYNAERDESMDFSAPYYTSAQVLIVKESDTTFDGCTTVEEAEAILAAQDKSYKIGTQKGTTGYMYSNGDVNFGYDGFTNLSTKIYDAGALAVKDLSNGRINAVIIDKQPAIMISQSINAGIKE